MNLYVPEWHGTIPRPSENPWDYEFLKNDANFKESLLMDIDIIVKKITGQKYSNFILPELVKITQQLLDKKNGLFKTFQNIFKERYRHVKKISDINIEKFMIFLQECEKSEKNEKKDNENEGGKGLDKPDLI